MSQETDDRPRNERYAIEELEYAMQSISSGWEEYRDESYVTAGLKFAEALDHLRLTEGEVTSYEFVAAHVRLGISNLERAFEDIEHGDGFAGGYRVNEAFSYTYDAWERLIDE